MENTPFQEPQIKDSGASSAWNNAQMTCTPSAKELAAKFRSKGEVYRFLTVDVRMALPAYDQVTIYFMKDLMAGNKKRKCHPPVLISVFSLDVLQRDIRTFVVPAYESLTLAKIWAFLGQFAEVQEYYPDHRDRSYLPKAWVCDIAATVVGNPFEKWVDEQIQDRNIAVKKDQGVEVMMDRKVYEPFQNSTHVSRKCILFFYQLFVHVVCYLESNGVAYHMLKMGNTRRRNKAEIKADKAAKLTQEAQQEHDKEELARLREEKQVADLMEQSNAALRSTVEQLITDGTLKVNEHGGIEKAD